jgi:hypothetical protein
VVYAAIGGAVTAGGIYGFLLWRKKKELEAMITGVTAGAGDSALAREAAAVRARITARARDEATALARVSAERYMGEVYGLTAERISSIGLLANRLGA